MTTIRTIAVTVRLSNTLNAQLNDRAQAEQTSCSEVLRKALEQYFETTEQAALLDDLRQNLLARMESLEHCLVGEIKNLVADNDQEGGQQ